MSLFVHPDFHVPISAISVVYTTAANQFHTFDFNINRLHFLLLCSIFDRAKRSDIRVGQRERKPTVAYISAALRCKPHKA